MSTYADNILKISDLAIGYSERQDFSLSSVNLVAANSELIALIGKNGSGKSTLLRTICGLQKKIDGKIEINNQEIELLSGNELAKKISFVSTEKIFVANLKVKDIISFGRYPYTNWFGKLSQSDNEKVKNVIDLLNLNFLENKLFHQLSDGEKQRVMIARAVVQDTELIILDEPTAFLDVQNKYEVVLLLKKLCIEKQKTIIFSTHDLQYAIGECDKIWLLNQDSIIEGSPEDLILSGKLTDSFSNKNIQFSEELGEFMIKRTIAGNIGLSGNGIIFNWTKKALERNNLLVECNKNNSLFVTIQTNDNKIIWQLNHYESEYYFNTIYELINYIKNLKI